MKVSVFNITLTVFLSAFALAIAFPTLIIRINNDYYKIRGIDPQDLNAKYVVKEFTFQPAIDVQGGNIITLDVDMGTIADVEKDTEFQRIKDILFTRLTYANFGDFELTSLVNKNEGKYRIILKLPNNIPTELVNLLVTAGNVRVWVEDPNSQIKPEEIKTAFDGRKVTDITNSDFASVSVISGDSRIFVSDPTKPNNFGLKVIFKDEAVYKFFTALYSSPRQTLAMMFTVDNAPVAVQTSGQLFNQLNPGKELLLFTIVPDTSLDNAVLAAIFSTPPLPANVTVSSVAAIPPPLGVTFLPNLKIALLVAFITVQSLLLFYFKRRAYILIVINSIYLVVSIALLKIFNVTLSLALIWGYLLSLVGFLGFMLLVLNRIRSASRGAITNEELSAVYQMSSIQNRNIFILAVLIALVFYFYGNLLLKHFAFGWGFGVASGFLVIILPLKALLPLFLLKFKKR